MKLTHGLLLGLLLVAQPVVAQPVVAQDAINLNDAAVFASPADIASWPVTARISAMSERPHGNALEGLSFATTPILPESWKLILDPNGDNFQFTVWACAKTPVWSCSGFIQMWQGRQSTGAASTFLEDFHQNWAYASRWGTLADYQPRAGDTMAFFLSAGNARGTGDVTSVRERSNVVLYMLTADGFGDATYAGPVVTPTPDPTPVPPPVVIPAPPAPTPEPTPEPVPIPAPVPSTPLPVPTSIPAPAAHQSTLLMMLTTIISGIISIIIAAIGAKVL